MGTRSFVRGHVGSAGDKSNPSPSCPPPDQVSADPGPDPDPDQASADPDQASADPDPDRGQPRRLGLVSRTSKSALRRRPTVTYRGFE